MRETSADFWKAYYDKDLGSYRISSLEINTKNKEKIIFDDEMLDKYINAADNIFTQSSGGNAFPYGKVILDTLQLELWNGDMKWTYIPLADAKIKVSVECEDSAENKTVFELGEFIVVNLEADNGYQTLQLSRAYANKTRPPWDDYKNNNLALAIEDVIIKTCDYLGVEIETELSELLENQTLTKEIFNNPPLAINLPWLNTQLADKMESAIDVLEVCAATLGVCFKIGINNALSLYSFDKPQISYFINDGGNLDDFETPKYLSGDQADGGRFADYNNRESDSFTFLESRKIHFINSDLIINLSYSEQVEIMTLTKKTYNYFSKSDGDAVEVSNSVGDETGRYALDVSNTFDQFTAIGNPLEFQKNYLERLKNKIGIRFIPFECDVVGNIAYDVGDLIIIQDVNGHAFLSFIGEVSTVLCGYTTIKLEKPKEL